MDRSKGLIAFSATADAITSLRVSMMVSNLAEVHSATEFEAGIRMITSRAKCRGIRSKTRSMNHLFSIFDVVTAYKVRTLWTKSIILDSSNRRACSLCSIVFL